MACYHMIPAREFSGRMRLRVHPDYATHWLPCGKCIGCKDAKAAMWSLRLRHEARAHSHTTFLTLTYEDEKRRKADPKHEVGLCFRDLQLFWKRLRKETNQKIKYYSCGEYGERTQRPHYHAVVYGLEPFPDERKYDMEQVTSSELDRIWGLGNALKAPITAGRLDYVTQYVRKKAGWTRKLYCDADGVLQEEPFQQPSKGLGKTWLDKYAYDLREGWVLIDGRKAPIPRYYKDKIKSTMPALADEIEQRLNEHRATLPAPDPARQRAAEVIREQQLRKARRDRV